MRGLFGVLSLLIVVAVVGLLVKKQFSSVNEIRPPSLPGVEAQTKATPATATATASPSGTVHQQSQQIQQQFKAAAEAAVQQARPIPDEK